MLAARMCRRTETPIRINAKDPTGAHEGYHKMMRIAEKEGPVILDEGDKYDAILSALGAVCPERCHRRSWRQP